MKEQGGDATMMQSGRDGYDQGFNDMGLAYRPPTVPDQESRMAKKIEKLFKGIEIKEKEKPKPEVKKFKDWLKETDPDLIEWLGI
jgi:hypothetical protein